MLAVHLENLLFLLLLVLGGLFQLLGRSARKSSPRETDKTPKPLPRTPRPIPRAGPQSDQERIRKFLEALGNPPASTPPQPVAPGPVYRKPVVFPRVPPMASPLPPLVTRPPDLPHEIKVPREPIAPPAQAFQIHEPPAPPEPVPLVTLTPTVAHGGTPPQTPAPQASIDVRTLLTSIFTLRDAIVLREILGVPRGLQQFEETQFNSSTV